MGFNHFLKRTITKSQQCNRNWDLSKQITDEDLETMKTAVTQCSSKQNRVFYKVLVTQDRDKREPWPYAIHKAVLDKANDQLFYQGADTTCIRFGYFDSPRVAHIDTNKMSIQYCVDTILWVLNQPHRIKDITVCP